MNLTKLEPGAATSILHWHEQEDEFIYMLEGELVLPSTCPTKAMTFARLSASSE